MRFISRIMALAFLLAPMWAGPAGAQAPEHRFALVIGNSEYKAGRLPTAANDAGLVAETLRVAGFDVAGARELDQDTLRRSIREFLDKVSAAGPQAVSFIYLAGYGLQFEGENYIVPVDATIARDEDIPIEAIRISDITRPLSGTPGTVKLIVVDAARQHPYTPAGLPLASGLALVEPDSNMLIAFNTAPGSVAPIENGPYGAFAQALSEMIGTGGVGLDDVFARLRLRVNETTNGVAVPWYASKITRPFLFTEPTQDTPPPPQVASTVELQNQTIRQFPDDQQAYAAALERDTIEGYEEFIAGFPDSPQARRVRALIAVRREALMWWRVLSINSQESYWSYLERYPQGAHVADAERRLARLAADYDPPPAFVPMAFADIPAPPPDEVVYLTQPEVVFDDPVFVPPPPLPVFFCPPRRREFWELPPPPPPPGAFFLPAPAVSFFAGPRPQVRPPTFVVAPSPPPAQQITINQTTIINQRRGGDAAVTSPALPGAVVTRVNSGALHMPPPAPPSLRNASPDHPRGSVLGTRMAMPPRMHAATASPAGSQPSPGITTPAVTAPTLPGGPHPPAPNTATTVPGGPHPPAAMPGAHQRPVPNAAATPGGPHELLPPGGQHQAPPNMATTTPGAPQPPPALPGAHPPGGPGTGATPGAAPPHAPPPVTHNPPPPAPRVAAPSPPPHAPAMHSPPPAPRVAAPSPPPHAPVATHNPPPRPQIAAPSPPPHAPPPPPAVHAAPPPPPARAAPPPPRAAPPPPGRKCVVENGRQVCK